MPCNQCTALLDAYQRAVKRYSDAVLKMSGTVEDDFCRALDVARNMWIECQNASAALNAHGVQDHGLDPALAKPRGSRAAGGH